MALTTILTSIPNHPMDNGIGGRLDARGHLLLWVLDGGSGASSRQDGDHGALAHRVTDGITVMTPSMTRVTTEADEVVVRS